MQKFWVWWTQMKAKLDEYQAMIKGITGIDWGLKEWLAVGILILLVTIRVFSENFNFEGERNVAPKDGF